MTADSGTSGATYSAAVDLPEIQEVTMDFEEGDVRELRAEGTVVQRSVAAGSTVLTIRFAGFNLTAIKDLWGHTLVQTGTTPNEIGTLTGKPNASKPHFKLQVLAINNDGGSTRLTLYKVQMDGEAPSLGLQDGEWAEIEATATAYWTTATTVVNSVAQALKWEMQFHETALANAAA
jgi:hypothetical protein